MLKIVDNLSKLPKDVKKWDARRRKAVAIGINWCGWDVRDHLKATMQKEFDRPTPWTLNSMYLKRATADDFDARIKIKDFVPKGIAPVDYLKPQLEGGYRRDKRTELHLRRSGRLQAGMSLVPGHDAKLNKYGNVPKHLFTKALSDIGVQHDPKQNTKRKKKKYFWLPAAGRRLAGIYWRQGGGLRALMVAVRKPAYSRRFDFFGEARSVTDAKLNRSIDRALDRYLK